MNPNNCSTCDYLELGHHDNAHCYMFREEPNCVCMQHTCRAEPLVLELLSLFHMKDIEPAIEKIIKENIHELYED